MKLSKAQYETLADVSEAGESGRYIADSYPPVKKLVGFGFIERISGKWGNIRYRITEAGKAALEGGE